MSLEHEIQKIIDPYGIYTYIKNAKMDYEGRIWNPRAKNILTKKSMFLKTGTKVTYEYRLAVGYEPPEYEYITGRDSVYMTPKQFVLMCLK